jgi:hypothetical protein
VTHRQTDENQQGSHKQSNLQAGTNGNTQAQIHLILHRYLYSYQMFSHIAHQRNEDNLRRLCLWAPDCSLRSHPGMGGENPTVDDDISGFIPPPVLSPFLLPDDLAIIGAIFDVKTGRLSRPIK